MPLIFIFLLFTATFFAPVSEEALSRVEPQNVEGEVVMLPYTPSVVAIDTSAEEELLRLVNEERRKEGLNELILDNDLVRVARKHSVDMWERKYFAHKNPDGETALERMQEEEINFTRAGENLALTRSVERAHVGLMNSPGHKRNILDPEYKKVGIGVVDGGIYGKMFTQNFSD